MKICAAAREINSVLLIRQRLLSSVGSNPDEDREHG